MNKKIFILILLCFLHSNANKASNNSLDKNYIVLSNTVNNFVNGVADFFKHEFYFFKNESSSVFKSFDLFKLNSDSILESVEKSFFVIKKSFSIDSLRFAYPIPYGIEENVFNKDYLLKEKNNIYSGLEFFKKVFVKNEILEEFINKNDSLKNQIKNYDNAMNCNGLFDCSFKKRFAPNEFTKCDNLKQALIANEKDKILKKIQNSADIQLSAMQLNEGSLKYENSRLKIRELENDILEIKNNISDLENTHPVAIQYKIDSIIKTANEKNTSTSIKSENIDNIDIKQVETVTVDSSNMQTTGGLVDHSSETVQVAAENVVADNLIDSDTNEQKFQKDEQNGNEAKNGEQNKNLEQFKNNQEAQKQNNNNDYCYDEKVNKYLQFCDTVINKKYHSICEAYQGFKKEGLAYKELCMIIKQKDAFGLNEEGLKHLEGLQKAFKTDTEFLYPNQSVSIFGNNVDSSGRIKKCLGGYKLSLPEYAKLSFSPELIINKLTILNSEKEIKYLEQIVNFLSSNKKTAAHAYFAVYATISAIYLYKKYSEKDENGDKKNKLTFKSAIGDALKIGLYQFYLPYLMLEKLGKKLISVV